MIGGFSFDVSKQCCFYTSAFKFSILCYIRKSAPLCYRCCVYLENEALKKNIGRWETTLVGYHILHLSVLIWWGMIPIKGQCLSSFLFIFISLVIIDYPCQFKRDCSVFDLIFETPI